MNPKLEAAINNSTKYAVIPKEDYISLLKDSILLSYLEAGGVDNWQYYHDAYVEYLQEIDEYEY